MQEQEKLSEPPEFLNRTMFLKLCWSSASIKGFSHTKFRVSKAQTLELILIPKLYITGKQIVSKFFLWSYLSDHQEALPLHP